MLKKIYISFLSLLSFSFSAFSQSEDGQQFVAASDTTAAETAGGVDVLGVINHHISDSHHWNVFAWQGSDGTEKSLDIPLPVMAFYNGTFLCAMSSSLSHGASVDCNGVVFTLDHHDKLLANGSTEGVFDISLTRNVMSGIVCGLLLLIFFCGAARSIRKTGVPRGGAGLAEILVVFVKEIADDQIGKEKGARFTPFLLTLFFFIWLNNIIGLIPFFPGGTNLSGNIAFTGILAIFTFVVTHIFANKHYWIHTFTVPGVPAVMKLIMVPLEIVTMFTRPFTLLIRLFANITGGHIIVISLFSMIFLLQTYLMSLVSVPLGFMVFVLELIFGALQAYIFTVLSALYIGLAVNAGHDD